MVPWLSRLIKRGGWYIGWRLSVRFVVLVAFGRQRRDRFAKKDKAEACC